jgi:peptide/nickel transport system permease protein
MTILRKIALGIAFAVPTASFIARLDLRGIELHHLEQTLAPGMDAFGRNCLLLTLAAISNSLTSILPVLVFTLAVSLVISFGVSGTNATARFALRAVLDLLSALPGLLLALSLGVVFPESNFTPYLATVLMVIPSTIRYFESILLKVRSEDFILAADSMGAPPGHIWAYHLLPALRDSVLAVLPFVVLRLILIETSISFLGLTPAPEHETWGRLLAQGKDYFLEAPWILVISALPLCLLLASFHLLSHEDQN